MAEGIDKSLNGDAKKGERENGFILLVFPFNASDGAKVNYVSNTSREDTVAALKEIVARFEGRVVDHETKQ